MADLIRDRADCLLQPGSVIPALLLWYRSGVTDPGWRRKRTNASRYQFRAVPAGPISGRVRALVGWAQPTTPPEDGCQNSTAGCGGARPRGTESRTPRSAPEHGSDDRLRAGTRRGMRPQLNSIRAFK